MRRGHFRSAIKSRGPHTSYLRHLKWLSEFIKQCDREPLIEGINLGPMLGGGKKSNYLAEKVAVGIKITVFSKKQQQNIILYTKFPEKVAENLNIQLY